MPTPDEFPNVVLWNPCCPDGACHDRIQACDSDSFSGLGCSLFEQMNYAIPDSIKHENLPRLLYLGDVPVESSYHGSALLYRLLQNYPRDDLFICEGNLSVSQAERRLPRVCYATFRVGNSRLLHTRVSTYYSSWLTFTAAARLRRAAALLNGFEPEAVLTVAHGYSWITAARLALAHGVPLHLICHDDWPRLAHGLDFAKNRLDATFGEIYRQAASRFCVSPFMRDAYCRRYGRDGNILFPSKAADCPEFNAPPERVSRNDHPFLVAFAGTINSPGYVRALKALARALEVFNGRLSIFGPITPEAARRSGLEGPNITLCGLVTSDELMVRFREEVDVLFVPMSFDPADRDYMEMGFPSKLTDYSAVGLPLLIYGPSYCSAVRWAVSNPGVAEVVDDENHKALAEALGRLAASPAHRIKLGTEALNVGRRYFTQEAAQAIFQRALVSHRILAKS